MKCFSCENEARAVCRFCGRAVCEEHVKSRPFVQAVYLGSQGIPKVIAVKDAVYCGICVPAPLPIEMPELD